jgi:micrococcal nuclease
MTPLKSAILASIMLATPADAIEAWTVATDKVRVVDGDTLADQTACLGKPTRKCETHIRLRNIDTPETGSRHKCEREKQLGKAATAFVKGTLAKTKTITITPPIGRQIDKHGRVLAAVWLDGTTDLGELLVKNDHALDWVDGPVAYQQRHKEWCPEGVK